ncbi:hypothetical protein BJ508DRAFT_304000 [Ascobolus immersus RN42]|uniref:Uncharacterized protein n=1 Tax=Ascobolus immersus RN42 TaxID=1160509 RepID=A0A3N4IDG9_ASCIM|nr:hypothetical protein BJ508DRAFT_304000 [Ascobolus immersus RN42]
MVSQPDEHVAAEDSPAPAPVTKKGGKGGAKAPKDGLGSDSEFTFFITCVKRLNAGKFDFQAITDDVNKEIEDPKQHKQIPAIRMRLTRMLAKHDLKLSSFENKAENEAPKKTEDGVSEPSPSTPAKKARKPRASKKRKVDSETDEPAETPAVEEKTEEKIEKAEEQAEGKIEEKEEKAEEKVQEKEENTEDSGDVDMEAPN